MLARSIDMGFCEFALIAGKHGFALPKLENTPLAITDNIQSAVGFGWDCNVSDHLIRGIKPFGEFLRAKNAGIIKRWLDRTIFAGGRCTKQSRGRFGYVIMALLHQFWCDQGLHGFHFRQRFCPCFLDQSGSEGLHHLLLHLLLV